MRIGPSLSLTQFRGSGGGITVRLAAPGNVSVEVAGTTYEVTFDGVTGAASYEWRLDGAGSWTNIGTATSFSSTAAAGSHTVQVRAIDAGAVTGHIGSHGFTIDAELFFTPADDPMFTPADDLMFV